jgi:hypothetical protein
MHSLIVAVALVSGLAFASDAFAQTTQPPTQPSAPATSASTLDEVSREHPIRTSLVRAALYSRMVALLALAAQHCAGGTSPSSWLFQRARSSERKSAARNDTAFFARACSGLL